MRTGLTGDDEIARLGRQVDDTIARLDREERMRRELFAAVSHDLRTPITALGLLATAIDDEVVEDAKRREYAARMNTHVRALGALIDDLFDLTRLQAQELQWTMERVAVEELVHDAVEAMRPAADAGAVAVRAELRPPLGRLARQRGAAAARAVQPDPERDPPHAARRQRHRPRRGRRRRRRDRGRRHRHRASPPDQRERVFEPFYRGDASRQSPGAGLGLAIARAIVEAHGGAIWLEEAPAGTRVRFRLPAAI